MKAPYVVYVFDGKWMRKVAEYQTIDGYQKKLTRYASFPASNPVYLTVLGKWYRAVFHEPDGRGVRWSLVESEAVER